MFRGDGPALPDGAFPTGFSVSTRALIAEAPRTTRDLVQRGAVGAGHRLLSGSPEQIADDLRAWYESGAADGFTIMPADTAVDLPNFARLVVPLLQKRGLFPDDYAHPAYRRRLGL
ncbi:hypothetical protein [Actinoplanes derwentensis]|uniref:hypothetical protein n=1 Tax=Actinoplanes derwentensis TaxID=113562 RepID=UPI0018D281DF|nr:hypothetical protein [Actinoplanes derwentensis]GID89887.1 hypothetical protein Ade03nite_88110 [Actinoplanes derwentensis]